MVWSRYGSNIVNIDLSQEIFAIDMLRSLEFSLKHRRKHVLRPLQLYYVRCILKSFESAIEFFFIVIITACTSSRVLLGHVKVLKGC